MCATAYNVAPFTQSGAHNNENDTRYERDRSNTMSHEWKPRDYGPLNYGIFTREKKGKTNKIRASVVEPVQVAMHFDRNCRSGCTWNLFSFGYIVAQMGVLSSELFAIVVCLWQHCWPWVWSMADGFEIDSGARLLGSAAAAGTFIGDELWQTMHTTLLNSKAPMSILRKYLHHVKRNVAQSFHQITGRIVWEQNFSQYNVARVVNTEYRDVVWLDKHFIIPFNRCQIIVTTRPYCRYWHGNCATNMVPQTVKPNILLLMSARLISLIENSWVRVRRTRPEWWHEFTHLRRARVIQFSNSRACSRNAEDVVVCVCVYLR